MIDNIDKWDSLCGGLTDADPHLIHSAGLFLHSSCMRYFKMLTTSSISLKGDVLSGMQCNIWFIVNGRTRITRKSSVIGKIEDIIDLVVPSAKCSDEFTPEAFITEGAGMAQPNSLTTHMIWIQDECLSIFQKMKKPEGYMTGIDSILSRVYDGKTVRHRTEKRGIETLKSPYFTFLVASTEALPQTFSETSFVQGFLNRPIYVCPQKAVWKPNTLKFSLSSQEKALLAEIVEFLKALMCVDHGVVLALDQKAKEMYDKYDREIFEKIDGEDLGIKEGYTGNLPNLVLKLAAIYRVARMDITELDAKNLKTLYSIETEDVQKAIKYVNEVALPGLEKVVSLINRQYIKNQPVVSNERVIELVKTYLRNSSLNTMNSLMKNAMTYTDLMRKLNISTNKFHEITDAMVVRKEIVILPAVEMPLGRRPTVIQLQEP